MLEDIPKAYDSKKVEDKLYELWEKSGFFNPDNCIKEGLAAKDAEVFSIVLPPPNVTGMLHMGHAAMLAIQDVLIRYHRMKGHRTLSPRSPRKRALKAISIKQRKKRGMI